MTSFKEMVQTVYGAVMSADEQKKLAEMQRLMNLQTKSKDQVKKQKNLFCFRAAFWCTIYEVE